MAKTTEQATMTVTTTVASDPVFAVIEAHRVAGADSNAINDEYKPTAFQGAFGQPTEPCLAVVGRFRILLLHDLPFQVVVDGVAARQVHSVWSRLDPWRGQLPPADVTACASRRRIVADGLHGQSSSTTSIAPSFHGRREGTGELEPIAQVIVSCHRGI